MASRGDPFRFLIPKYRKVDFFIVSVCFLAVLITDWGMATDLISNIELGLGFLLLMIFIGVIYSLQNSLKASRPSGNDLRYMVFSSVLITALGSVAAGFVAFENIKSAAAGALDIAALLLSALGMAWGGISVMYILMMGDTLGHSDMRDKYIEGNITRGMAVAIVIFSLAFGLAYRYAFGAHWSYTLMMGIVLLTSASHLFMRAR
jgi:hypothetical protein